MDYNKHYNKLISRGRNRLLEGYCEKHHIIPRCMDGCDMDENIVKLTPEEHYLAHLLLVKIYPKVNGLLYAVHLMGSLHNNKQYGWAKRKHAKMLSETRSGTNHPLYGKIGTMTGKKHTNAAIIKMTKPRSEKAKINMSNPTGKDSPNYGKKHTEQSKKKMRVPKPTGFSIGKANSMYGKQHKKTTRQLMSERAKNRKIDKCIHCGKKMASAPLTRYHNDNCKLKVGG